jgi:serine/threonine protein kinase
MQPPISNGTILQNRYHIVTVLGQGGFGRTYLAEDQGRFRERCALKEFLPLISNSGVLDKSRELFQREAAILYQIQHPQIPQFRATFEENQRLFLVQDYVEGQTYRALLNERQTQGATFSEAETIQLMRQLLPVLAHIHSKGIIHRDISPDNIILRRADHLPVLIDFGVVKEIATRVQSPETTPQHTTVGKLGYAPGEQMQSGQAYPNSDLYALAVTVVVLLTGKEPAELYDDRTLTWYWQQWTSVSDAFAQVINTMLSYRPGDRYQSARDVVKALEAFSTAARPSVPPPVHAPPPSPAPRPAPAPSPEPSPDVSQMPTMAVGQAYEPTHAGNAPPNLSNSSNYRHPVVRPAAEEGSVWDNPIAVFLIFVVTALIVGLLSWAIVGALLTPVDDPEPTPTTPEPTPTAPEPTPTPPPEPVEYSQRIELRPDQSTTVEGNLQSNETINYTISAEQGQTLTVAIEDEGVLLSVLAPNGDLADAQADRVQRWQGELEFTGNYVVQVSPVRGLEESSYSMALQLEAAPEPEPEELEPEEPEEPEPEEPEEPELQEPEEPPAPIPEVITQSVEFPAGADGATVEGFADETVIRRYLVQASEGQILQVEVFDGDVRLDIRRPNGRLVDDAAGVLYWEAVLTRSGRYAVDVIAGSETDYSIDIQVVDIE